MRLISTLAGLIGLFGAGSAMAEPMWQIADRWTCNSTMHISVYTDGSDPDFNKQHNTLIFDFGSGNVSTQFADVRGRIGFTRYSESRWGQFNLIEVMWDGQAYPMIITRDNGEWWHTGGANWNREGEKMLTTTYKCEPT